MPVNSDNLSITFIFFVHVSFNFFLFQSKLSTIFRLCYKFHSSSRHFSNFIFKNKVGILGAVVIYWTRCYLLDPLLFTGPVVIYWTRCYLLDPLLFTGPVVIYWTRCYLLDPLLFTGPVVIYWTRCYLLDPLLN